MKRDDLSRSLVAFDQASTLVAVVELSLASWLVAGLVPHLSRQPLKKLRSDPEALLGSLSRWRDQATKAGGRIKRIVLAFEAGRDDFWLARWLRARGIEAYVIHPSSIPVSREHRRAKTDRLDAGLLMRAFLGWLRGEPKHCSMAAIPTVAEEDARRSTRERETRIREQTRAVNRIKSTLIRFGIRIFKAKLRRASKHLEGLRGPEGEPLPPNTMAELRRDLVLLQVIRGQIREIERARLERLKRALRQGTHPMMRMLARIMGISIETAEMAATIRSLSSCLDATRMWRRTVLGSEGEFETAHRLLGEPGLGLLRDVRGMIVEDQLDRRTGRIGGVEKLEEFNKLATAMAVLHQSM